jgi:hypothetical protein
VQGWRPSPPCRFTDCSWPERSVHPPGWGDGYRSPGLRMGPVRGCGGTRLRSRGGASCRNQLGPPRRRGRRHRRSGRHLRPLEILHKLGAHERIRSAADRSVPIWPSSPQTPRSPSATATSALGCRLRVGAIGC